MGSETVSFAIEIGKKVLNLSSGPECSQYNKERESKEKVGIVRRAVDFPSLMYDIGFSSAFLFYLSKVEEKSNIFSFYKYLESGEKNKSLCSELTKKEGSGYAGYIAILIYLLKRLNKTSDININAGNEKDIIKNILDLSQKVSPSEIKLVASYLIEVKRVMEALPL